MEKERKRDLLSFRLYWLYYDDKGNADPFIRLSNVPRFPRNRVSREKKTPDKPQHQPQFLLSCLFAAAGGCWCRPLACLSLSLSYCTDFVYIASSSFEKFCLDYAKSFSIYRVRGTKFLIPRSRRHLFVESFFFYLVFNSTIIGQEKEEDEWTMGYRVGEADGQCYRIANQKGSREKHRHDRRTDGRTVKS